MDYMEIWNIITKWQILFGFFDYILLADSVKLLLAILLIKFIANTFQNLFFI